MILIICGLLLAQKHYITLHYISNKQQREKKKKETIQESNKNSCEVTTKVTNK